MEAFVGYSDVNATKREIQYLLSLNATKKNVMTYDSFLATILPRWNSDLRGACLRRNNLARDGVQGPPSGEEVDEEAERLVLEIFAEEVEYFRKLEHARHKFSQKFGNQARKIFKQIDRYESQRVYFKELIHYFRRCEFTLTKEEFTAVLLRFSDLV